MVKLILSTQSFLVYLIVIIKVLENRFSYKREEIKNEVVLTEIYDLNINLLGTHHQIRKFIQLHKAYTQKQLLLTTARQQQKIFFSSCISPLT